MSPDQAAEGPATAAGLYVRLDSALPGALAVGDGTALFVCGSCFSAQAPIRSLHLLVDGDAQPLMAFGMPRLETFRALHPGVDPFARARPGPDTRSPEDPLAHSYRSGFWGLAQVVPRPGAESCELALAATLQDGGEARVRLASVPLSPPSTPAPGQPVPGADARVAIAMATFDPPQDLLLDQLQSIRAQTHDNWVCVISDDASHPERFAALQAAVAGDRRFSVSRSPQRLGFYRNFERALSLVPVDVDYVAPADQDDHWHPDKLASLIAGLDGAQLVYSDARIVDRQGRLIAPSYWGSRQNNHADVLSLLVANAVSGAACLFPRRLLQDALPFPPAQFAHYHDHWLGLVALTLGEVAFVPQPLYDYVQHGEAQLGHAAATRMTALRARLGSAGREPRARVRLWRLHYFEDVCRLMQFATVLRMRCGARMAPAKRRSLERFLGADRSWVVLLWLGLRGARELVRPRPQTLGAEWMLFWALLWRRLLSATARARPQRRGRLDSLPPTELGREPGRVSADGAAARSVSAKIAPLQLSVSVDAPQRVNILIPTIDLEHFFGGYIAKLNLALRLAQRGVRVRVVTVDEVPPLPRSWRHQLESYSGLAGLFDRVEVAFGRGQTLPVSREDRFVATTWWSAHIAHHAASHLNDERFLYLIQEYEPFTFPMGSFAALAGESYRFAHRALFSSELLRDYFRRHSIGVYAQGEAAGDASSASFENAITRVQAPGASALHARRTRRLLFYARPEPHAARNMFELGIIALERALAAGAFSGAWQLHGIGAQDSGRRIALGGGAVLELLERADQATYATILPEHDVGLALMLTPHPSLVPIEMASAGMLTVTNSFENKTERALSAISTNLLTVEPSIEAIARGLALAAGAVEDFERRARGSAVHWSRDWDDSFGEELMRRVLTFLSL